MAEVFISPSGNDSTGSGTRASPWKTINHAITNTGENDTITCLAGTYDGATNSWSNLSNSARVIRGDTGVAEDVVFDAGGGTFAGMSSGMTPGVGATSEIKHIRFYNSDGDGATAAAVFRYRDPGTLSFTNCLFDTIAGTGGSPAGGVFGGRNTEGMDPGFMAFDRCRFYRTNNGPVFTPSFGSNGGEVKLTNCTFWDDGGGGLPGNSAATPLFDQNLEDGDLVIKNCVFETTHLSDMIASGKSFNSYDTDYNCWDPNINVNHGAQGSNSLNVDPQMIDPTNKDFDLRPGSPCVDGGTANV